MLATTADTERLFFALWPDDLCRERLAREARKLYEIFGGRVTTRETFHMTLVFLGDISPDQAQLACVAGAAMTMRGFSLHMAGSGCWTHNKIAWLAPAVTPEPLAQLVTDLRRAVSDAGIAIEKRPFTPHVTLLRKAQCRPIDAKILPFEWRVRDFALIRSTLGPEGSHYDILERWEAD